MWRNNYVTQTFQLNTTYSLMKNTTEPIKPPVGEPWAWNIKLQNAILFNFTLSFVFTPLSQPLVVVPKSDFFSPLACSLWESIWETEVISQEWFENKMSAASREK